MSHLSIIQNRFEPPPPPPPCVKCGATTVIAPASEPGQRVFEVRCPKCGHAGRYSLDYE